MVEQENHIVLVSSKEGICVKFKLLGSVPESNQGLADLKCEFEIFHPHLCHTMIIYQMKI